MAKFAENRELASCQECGHPLMAHFGQPCHCGCTGSAAPRHTHSTSAKGRLIRPTPGEHARRERTDPTAKELSNGSENTRTMLVLFKGARSTAHLLQNLRLLAAPNGASLSTTYASHWFAPSATGSGSPDNGDECLIVLCTSQNRSLTPCRVGKLEVIEETGSARSFSIRLGRFVALTVQDRLASELQSWAHGLRPGHAFVSRGKLSNVVLADDQSETTSWRAVVNQLCGSTEYSNAAFARLAHPLGTLAVDEPSVMSIEAEYPAASTLEALLELTRGSASLKISEQRRDGLSVSLTPHTNEPLEGSLRLVASGVVFAPLDLNLSVRSPAVSTAPTTTSSVDTRPKPTVTPSDTDSLVSEGEHTSAKRTEAVALAISDVRRLIRERGSQTSDEMARRLGELMLESGTTDIEIISSTAALLAAAGRHREAADAFRRVDLGRLSVESLYELFTCECAAGRLAETADLLSLNRLDFASDPSFESLSRVLSELPDRSATNLGYELIDRALSEQRQLELFRILRARINEPSDVFRYANHVQYLSEHEALAFLCEHTEDDPTTPLLELVLEVASQTGSLAKVAQQAISLAKIRLAEGRVGDAFELTEIARSGSDPGGTYELARLVAEELSARHDRHADAVELLGRCVNDALARGDLAEAGALGELALSIASGDDSIEQWARELGGRVQRALEESEPLRSLLAQRRDVLLGTTRKATAGKTLVIAGGKKDTRTENQLHESLAFRKVNWLEFPKSQSPDITSIAQMDPEKTIVVVLAERISHAASNALRDHCERSFMPVIVSPKSGRAGIEDALICQFGRHESSSGKPAA